MKRADALAHRKHAKALCDVGELRAKQSERAHPRRRSRLARAGRFRIHHWLTSSAGAKRWPLCNAIKCTVRLFLMEWSGRAPAPPAMEAGERRPRQGARHVSDTQHRGFQRGSATHQVFRRIGADVALNSRHVQSLFRHRRADRDHRVDARDARHDRQSAADASRIPDYLAPIVRNARR